MCSAMSLTPVCFYYCAMELLRVETKSWFYVPSVGWWFAMSKMLWLVLYNKFQNDLPRIVDSTRIASATETQKSGLKPYVFIGTCSSPYCFDRRWIESTFSMLLMISSTKFWKLLVIMGHFSLPTFCTNFKKSGRFSQTRDKTRFPKSKWGFSKQDLHSSLAAGRIGCDGSERLMDRALPRALGAAIEGCANLDAIRRKVALKMCW